MAWASDHNSVSWLGTLLPAHCWLLTVPDLELDPDPAHVFLVADEHSLLPDSIVPLEGLFCFQAQAHCSSFLAPAPFRKRLASSSQAPQSGMWQIAFWHMSRLNEIRFMESLTAMLYNRDCLRMLLSAPGFNVWHSKSRFNPYASLEEHRSLTSIFLSLLSPLGLFCPLFCNAPPPPFPLYSPPLLYMILTWAFDVFQWVYMFYTTQVSIVGLSEKKRNFLQRFRDTHWGWV